MRNFKTTEIGDIPSDWSLCSLSEVAEVRGGIAKNSNQVNEDPIQVAYLRVANVQDGYLDLTDLSTIEISKQDLKRFSVLPGDVLMNEGGDLDKLGRGAVWRGQVAPCVHQNHVFAVRCKPRLLPEYLDVWTGTPEARRFFSLAGKQTTNLASISKSSLGELPIALPTKNEQRAIAASLSDTDALIVSLERLIAKKRTIKQAAMQSLLTSRIRLPGFSGAWKKILLGEAANIKTGSRNNSDKVEDGAYPFFVRSATVERINSYSYECEAILVPGEGQIGNIFHYVNGRFDVHQRVYAITQFENGVSGQYVHLYMSQHFGAWAMQNTVKATVDSLRLPTFQNFELLLPTSIEEQTAIATALSEMEAEIELIKSRLTKIRTIKQGMMQELLTGRTRLI